MTSSDATGRRNRFEALDGLRGVCAVMVVLLHVPASGALGEAALIRHAFLFVDFFFVLSGFVIAHSYADRLQTPAEVKRFVWARWRRVYPLHLAMLLVFLAFELATFAVKGPAQAFQGGDSLESLVANLLLVHAFHTVPTLGWNYPSWSISAEFGAYLLFAAGAMLLKRGLPVALLLVAALALAALWGLVGHIETTVAFGGLRCLAGFACGALMRLWLKPGLDRQAARAAPFLIMTLAEIGAIVVVAAFVAKWGQTSASLAAPLVFAAVVALFAHEGGAISRILRGPEGAFLGLVTYSIYMTHAFVISRLINVATVIEARTGVDLVIAMPDGSKAFSALASPLAATSAVLGAVFLAALAHRFIERPGQRLRLPDLALVKRPRAVRS